MGTNDILFLCRRNPNLPFVAEKLERTFIISFEFNFKSDESQKKHFGFIAQDMEKIFPDLVSDEQMGYKTVNYIELIPLMLSKMKQMQTEIDSLKEKLP